MISYYYTNTSTATNFSIKMDNLYLTSLFYVLDFMIFSGDSRISNLLIDISNSVIEGSF